MKTGGATRGAARARRETAPVAAVRRFNFALVHVVETVRWYPGSRAGDGRL